MPRWAIVMAHGDAESSRYYIQNELEGTESEALAALQTTVDAFQKASRAKSIKRQRRQVFRVSERSYFVRVMHRGYSGQAHFTLAELVADTHDDDLPDTVADLTAEP
ncbi:MULTISPECIES: hypothetical protein [unclassified Streptomyces]|uniref:hypothetical protein n=1 Tax=unclassified Streptomyces TaxID=2593676 RepID=UPI000B16716C|nr:MULTISPECIES: hypothetical protein [unclassified Streptomyces]MCX5266109.1 hypothetical protein [Streptomyces sp. NBC_00199]